MSLGKLKPHRVKRSVCELTNEPTGKERSAQRREMERSRIKTDEAPIMCWALNTPTQEFSEGGNMILTS